ncbi:cation:proton antiporter [Aeoliella sp. SH292]|uniref:cation:proton antiporter n=1 Tax=Aeoliella sp. SH292 TaxID=3454464 RepID=UPI003F948295
MIEITDTLHLLEAYDLTLLVLGLGVLGLATLLPRIEGLPFSFPIVALVLGFVAFALPLGLTAPDPLEHRAWAVHLTEIGVIISLMGVGLKIARRPSWRTWSTTWRMLGICMPLTIAGVAVLGWWMLGLSPAAALLLAAALAPTDPVLASDVQVEGPEEEVEEDIGVDEATQEDTEKSTGEGNKESQNDKKDKEEELRFTLTSEAGLNDSLAFPFTYLALVMATEGQASPLNWLVEWLLVDVVYRIAVGIAVGVAVGWVLAQVLLRLPAETETEKMKIGVGALAGTLLLYAATECVGGYGFLAVFIGGLTIRHWESTHQSHRSLHIFAEQSEQLLMTGIMIALGGAIAGGLLGALTWQAVVVSLLIVFVVRPVAGMIGLVGDRRLSRLDQWIASFYGIRGIGCLYYLAYGVDEGSFAEADLLWSTCAFTVVLSVFVHGMTATSVMRYRDSRA